MKLSVEIRDPSRVIGSMAKRSVEDRVGTILERARQQVQNLACQYRETTLLPFCRKHGLTYDGSMGTSTFYLDGKPLYVGDVNPKFSEFDVLSQILTDLGVETFGQGEDFGTFIMPVNKTELNG